jgi:hypothetical protein
MGKIKFKNANEYKNDEERVRNEIWEIQYQQRSIIEELCRKVTFQVLFNLYYMVNNFKNEFGSSAVFTYDVFMKFMDRAPDAPYEKFMDKLTKEDGISLFIKACLATEGQPGYAPIAYKLMVEYDYLNTLEKIAVTNTDRSYKFGTVNGILEFTEDFLGVTSPDIAKVHIVMKPIYQHVHKTNEVFLEYYNNIGVEDVVSE